MFGLYSSKFPCGQGAHCNKKKQSKRKSEDQLGKDLNPESRCRARRCAKTLHKLYGDVSMARESTSTVGKTTDRSERRL